MAVAKAETAHDNMLAVYDLISAAPFTYDPNEIETHGQAALTMSGDDRIYGLWSVLYAYKASRNETAMQAWRTRISALAQKEGDSHLDLLARFMWQAYENDGNAFASISDREWSVYLTAPNPALQNIVMIERERQLQYMRQWADAIDVGESLIVRLSAEGPAAEPALRVAHQTLAYSLTKVGDSDGYAKHMLAVARLSRSNTFFFQKMDMLYDLAYTALKQNDILVAQRLQRLHAAYVRNYSIADLVSWDQELCAMVSDAAGDYRAVISCLSDSDIVKGVVTDSTDLPKLGLLITAYARMGQVEKARSYLKKVQALPPEVYTPEPVFESYIEAHLLAGAGRNSEAFAALDRWTQQMKRMDEERRIASIQDMYQQLRKELDSKTAESRLLVKQVQMQRLLLGAAGLIAVLLAVIVVGGALWVLRMRRMHRSLNEAHDHAEAANAAKSRFLAVMSHELRTPLNGVLGMAQALKKDDLNETQREQVDILVDSGRTLLALLNDVLDMSRIEAGKVELAPTAASMKDMVERVINTYASLLGGKDVVLRYDLDDSAVQPMMFDVLRVYQCLSNLVSNAIKFTEKGSVRIVISAHARQDDGFFVRCEVRDTGIGMSQVTLDRLFEAYSQADAMTVRKYGGSGLGLNISRRLAELMGGTLSVTSEEGKGSAFVMTFRAGKVEQTQPVAEPVRPQPRESDSHLPGHHILLVDDHPVNRKVARLFLEPFGFVITEAADGQEALDLDMSRFDLVLMDLNMPRMGGLEATRLFRASEGEGRHIPIVALTADAMRDQVEACLAVGMDAHLAKPIIMDTLIDTVSRLLHLNDADTEAHADKVA